MGFQSDDNENDYEFSCPVCGSDQVVVFADEHNYMSIGRCKKCGYSKKND